MTRTSDFGVGRREGHDASAFYARALMQSAVGDTLPDGDGPVAPVGAWADNLYCHSSESMVELPDRSVGLAFTSPPYAVGKGYDVDRTLEEYLALIENVGREVWRVLVPGGRYVVNIANVGRTPYLPLTQEFWALHRDIGFLPQGEVIWVKGKGASGSCAWGSWRSSAAPRLRDLHEYLIVMTKLHHNRPDKGTSTLERDEFMASTLSVWEIPPASAKRIGHPAPFPVALATRVINLWSYADDVVLDPFLGSGTTAVAAVAAGRHYVGYDLDPVYLALAEERIGTTPRPVSV